MTKKNMFNSLEQMYLGYYKLLYTYISDYTKDVQNMQDIASIIWGKIAAMPEKYLKMDPNYFQNYLRAMVRTAVADYFETERRQTNKVEKAREALESEKTLESEYFKQEDIRFLEEALKVLSEEEQLLIELRFFSNFSVREVSEALEISESAIRVRQHRILKRLKSEIIRLQH